MNDRKNQSNPTLLILSENPVEQIWTHLSSLESTTLAKKLVQDRAIKIGVPIDESTAAQKGIALAYCIRNARENLISAIPPSLTTKVVTNYFGCLWLACAMMVSDPSNRIDLKKLESYTKSGHGIGNFTDSGQFPENEYTYF